MSNTPIVLVHGNPETPAVWDPLRNELERANVTALHLPGFGIPAPAGFGATKEEYVDWLISQVEEIGEPVDLVGHDWGGGFVLRVACTRSDLIHSWVSDVAGLIDPDYVWHDMAQVWQTPGAGEAQFAEMASLSNVDRLAFFEAVGIKPASVAQSFIDALDDEMIRCVLALYRSAVQPAMVEWGRDAAAAAERPGLVVIAAADPYTGGSSSAERMAVALGAKTAVLDGLGHWWMLEDPQRGAQMLEEFWDSID